MSQFLFDKANMALKAGRYDEAQSAYEQSLEKEYSIDGWCGLGLCKLFQLSSGVIMDEVIYCFEKAREVDKSEKDNIDIRLITYSKLVLEQLTDYSIAAINQLIKAEKEANRAAMIAAFTTGLAISAEKGNVRNIAGMTAGISAGVAVGKFGKMKSSAEAADFAFTLISQVYMSVKEFLLDNMKLPEAVEFSNAVQELEVRIKTIVSPGWEKAEEDAKEKKAKEKAEEDAKQEAEIAPIKELIESTKKLSKTGIELLVDFASKNNDNILYKDEIVKRAYKLLDSPFNYDHKKSIEAFCEDDSFLFGVNEGILFGKNIIYHPPTIFKKRDIFSFDYKDLLTVEYKPPGWSVGTLIINETVVVKGNKAIGLNKIRLPFWQILKQLIESNIEHFE